MSILNRLMTQEMKKDLEFYIAHNDQLYFYALSACAVLFVIITVTNAFLIISGVINASLETLLLVCAINSIITPTIGFVLIKLYFHIRKDALEIQEKLGIQP